MKEKIAFVVQRYGLEVNGGAEYHCRLIAELLSGQYEVDVLTTKALDYMTWKDHFSADIEQINDVTIRRFSSKPRNVEDFNKFSGYIFNDKAHTFFDELEWMKKQGPYSIDLLEYIRKEKDNYKVFIFFTYNYFTTFYGLQLVPEKSILIPTAHDEPPIYLSIYNSLFQLPKYILFNTIEERLFVQNKFRNNHIKSDVVGVGVNIPETYLSEEQFRDRFRIEGSYILYVGRIDESKGCAELFDYYLRLQGNEILPPKLVLIGNPVMKIPNNKNIISLGFVSEEEKFGGIAGATFMVVPSKYESLSMVTLESLSLQVPVLVNGQCNVLRGHCEASNAGLYYSNYYEFEECTNILGNANIRRKLGENGLNYVKKNYDWDRIYNKINNSIIQLEAD